MYSEYVDMWGAVFPHPVKIDSYRWNGWAVPYFAEENLVELVEFMNVQEFTGAPWSLDLDGVRGSHTTEICCNWNKFAENNFECACECDECRELWRWEILDGERVISVGGNAWCWSSSAPEDLAEEILGSFDEETDNNFELLRKEEIHRTQIEFSAIEFVLELSRWNGWALDDFEEFARAVNESAEMLVN
jgi:hypothetical protein